MEYSLELQGEGKLMYDFLQEAEERRVERRGREDVLLLQG